MGERKLVALDPDDLRAVLDQAVVRGWVVPDARQGAVARLRAAADAAFTVEDVKREALDSREHVSAARLLDLLRHRLEPPVEHKVTLRTIQREVGCSCGWEEFFGNTDDPWEPGRLAQEHLDSCNGSKDGSQP